MNKRIERGLMILVAILLPVVIMLSSLEATAFDESFYADMHEELNITEVVGTNSGELAGISSKIIDYLRNKTDSLDMKAEIGGESVEVFGEREKLHMVDVKKLFMGGFYLRNALLALVILSLFILYVMNDRKMKKPGKAILASGFTVVILSVLIATMVFTDFQKYFIGFHKIFFRNDLWILYPETDVLIQMLPIEFFISIVKRTVYIFLIQYALLMGIAYAAMKRPQKIKK
jgi:integral membrane protein (TIGR01906 family)